MNTENTTAVVAVCNQRKQQQQISTLLKAATLSCAQLRQTRWPQTIDLDASFRLFCRQMVRRNDDGGKQLYRLSNIFLGLCRLMWCQFREQCSQINQTFSSLSLSSPASSAPFSLRLSQSNFILHNRTFDSTGFHPFNEPNSELHQVLHFFREITNQLENVECQVDERSNMLNNSIENLNFSIQSNLSKTQIKNHFSSLAIIDDCQLTSSDTASEYFQNLYDQIASVDFIDECHDILVEHFGEQRPESGSESRPKRYSDLHQIEDIKQLECDFETNNAFSPYSTIESAFQEQSTPTKILTTSPKNCRNKAKKRKTITKKRTARKYKNQNFFKCFLEKLSGTKIGYRYLREERANRMFTEPARTMPTLLKQLYFRPTTMKFSKEDSIKNFSCLSTASISKVVAASVSPSSVFDVANDNGLMAADVENMIDKNPLEKICETSACCNNGNYEDDFPEIIGCEKLDTNFLKNMIDIIRKTIEKSISLFILDKKLQFSQFLCRIFDSYIIKFGKLPMTVNAKKMIAAQSFHALLNMPNIKLLQTFRQFRQFSDIEVLPIFIEQTNKKSL